MKKRYYPYEEFIDDINKLYNLTKEFNPDTILPIARGGLTIGHFLGMKMDLRSVFAINSIHYDDTKKLDKITIENIPNLKDSKRVLIVDDIVDSGDTAKAILELLKNRYQDIEFKLATIFFKSQALVKPDFTLKEAKEWIDFFWEVDILKEEE